MSYFHVSKSRLVCVVLFSFSWMWAAERVSGHICNISPPPPSQLCVALSFLYERGCSPGSSVSTNMETWPTTLSEVIGEQGPLAGWSSSLTFSRHHPLLTPQLTSTSAPLLEEQRGRPPPLYILSLFPFIIFCLGTPRPQEIAILFH